MTVARLVLALILWCLCNSFSPVSSVCSRVDSTSDFCRSENTIRVSSRTISKGSDAQDIRVTLPALETEADWYCGDSKERVAWSKKGNQLRVKYFASGRIHWEIYRCEDLDGPKVAGRSCGVPEQTSACPKFTDDSPACVYELKTSTSHVNQRTTTVSVQGTVRAEVTKKAGNLEAKASAEVSGGVSHSVTNAKIVNYQSKTYMVIPAGFSFCSFTNATSVKDPHFSTGFRWSCSFTKFVQRQGRFDSLQCTNLEKCDAGVCGGGTSGVWSLKQVNKALALTISVFSSISIISAFGNI